MKTLRTHKNRIWVKLTLLRQGFEGQVEGTDVVNENESF